MEVDPQILDDLMKNPGYEGQQANTTSEFYAESFSEVLAKSIGYFVTAEFLIGSNNLVERSGILYAVGNNFMTLQVGPDGPFMICDVYSVKFVTVYNSRTRPENFGQRNFQTNAYRNASYPGQRR